MPRSLEEDFKKMHQFSAFYPKVLSPWDEGALNFQFLLSLNTTHHLVKIGLIVIEKNMLTDDALRTTCAISSNKSPR